MLLTDVKYTIIIAHRMLQGLLSASGANASLVTVYIDGFFQEPKEVAGLFSIRAVEVE